MIIFAHSIMHLTNAITRVSGKVQRPAAGPVICLICARCVLMASCQDRPHDFNIGCSSAKVDTMFNHDFQPRAIADRQGVPIRHAYLQGEPLTMAASVNTQAISRSLPFNLS
jgi:hypothetical protein